MGTKLLGSMSSCKNNPYANKNVFGHVVEPLIGSKDSDELSLMDIKKLVLTTTPYQALLAFVFTKTFFRKVRLQVMHENNPKIL